jgi:hypothetical protein
MQSGKKKRDVKFIIYQSLYILVIASLSMNDITLSNIEEYVKVSPEDTVVSVSFVESLSDFDPKLDTILNKKTAESFPKIDSSAMAIDTTISKEQLRRLELLAEKGKGLRTDEGRFKAPEDKQEVERKDIPNPTPTLRVGNNTITNTGRSTLRISIKSADGESQSVSIAPGQSESFVIRKGDDARWKYD